MAIATLNNTGITSENIDHIAAETLRCARAGGASESDLRWIRNALEDSVVNSGRMAIRTTAIDVCDRFEVGVDRDLMEALNKVCAPDREPFLGDVEMDEEVR